MDPGGVLGVEIHLLGEPQTFPRQIYIYGVSSQMFVHLLGPDNINFIEWLHVNFSSHIAELISAVSTRSLLRLTY